MVTNNITIYLNNYHLMAKKYRFILLLLILTLVQARATASATAKPAYWIAVPQTSAHDYGVYYFRKNLNLTQLPAAMRVEVSGDNRYELYVNGQLASAGPAKGDLHHWRNSRFKTLSEAG